MKVAEVEHQSLLVYNRVCYLLVEERAAYLLSKLNCWLRS